MLLTGCEGGGNSIVAGLPNDLANMRTRAGFITTDSARTLAFDGYYRGTVAPAQPVPAGCAGAAFPRDMLAVDGRATFGVNLPFSSVIAADGRLSMRYLDVATLQGRFAGPTFTGTLLAKGGPSCPLDVRLAKVEEPPPPELPSPLPIDMQAGAAP